MDGIPQVEMNRSKNNPKPYKENMNISQGFVGGFL
jgi:hypothetical protein